MSIELSRQSRLDDSDRQTLIALADVLIPVSERMPSASQAGVGGEWIDRALTARSDWFADFVALLQNARGKDPRTVLAELQVSAPASFTMLTELVAGAYLMNTEVRKLIGYSGQRAIPIQESPEDLQELQELIDPVKQRGPIYGSCP
jgi:hypothetical protein